MKKNLFIIIVTTLFAINITAKEQTKQESKAIPEARMSVTQHKGKFNGHNVSYQINAGDSHLVDKEGKPKASIFHIAYTRTNVKNAEKRPLLFVFNGGPGSSSVWMHMGLFGPKRVVLPSDAERVGAAPFNLKDNPLSLLDIADLVFIDPVGTGFSKPLGEYKGKAFWGVKEDAEILAEFVRVYITENNRWNSPKYLVGESYGTTRAGAMVKELQEGWGSIDLNGILLISSIIDFQTGDFTEGNDLPFVTFLPTYAATAWYHDKVPNKADWEDLSQFLNATRDFALNEYATVLLKGALATPQEIQNVVEKLHAFTGLKKQYIQQSDMRISEFPFMKELLRDQGKVVGRLDSRYLGEDANVVTDQFEADPASYAIDGAYTAAIQHYFANDIDVKRTEPYHILSGEVFGNWNWLYGSSARSQGFINVTPFISKGMRQNKDFRVFVANGYYDLATPFFATEHSMNHHGIDLNRVTMKYYEAGHMMYVHEPSLKALVEDIRTFILP
ncbi:S10 family peptidase [Aliiglaciecola lipolytica]|uniref:Peptidase S10, serine carboxypeptidase n=1 Tax=Aliiglaciecola lipolytica E3 TaxID=1127673 RepID=K6YIE6_9ALTE|nr:peptidase S10 [Aliiglaciecola lipolytica]GAC16363.1 peptidase S10, serine carboxypeptidase [Aliiglaciecola lipolytica E3]